MLKFTKPGNTVAKDVVHPNPSSQPKLRTLGDLFPVLKDTLTAHEYTMQRWAADRAASLFGIQRDQVLIDDLVEIDSALKQHLRLYSPQSIRSACNYVHRILYNAEKLGWQPSNADIRQIPPDTARVTHIRKFLPVCFRLESWQRAYRAGLFSAVIRNSPTAITRYSRLLTCAHSP